MKINSRISIFGSFLLFALVGCDRSEESEASADDNPSSARGTEREMRSETLDQSEDRPSRREPLGFMEKEPGFWNRDDFYRLELPDMRLAVRKLLEEHESREIEIGFSHLFTRFGRIDVDAGLAMLDEIPVGRNRDQAVGYLFNGISDVNPDGLLTTLEKISDPEALRQIYRPD